MMALGKFLFTAKVTKNTKFGEAIFRNLRALRVLRGEISFSLTCTFTILGALLVPAFGGAQSLCVRLSDASGIVRSVPAQLGDALRLKFRHSIYGSQVEELFTLRPGGFALSQLRYSEARLVDFYGHENAVKEAGMWVVTPAPALISALHVNLSADAAMSLRFDRSTGSEPVTIQPNGALRLTVASCQSRAHD